MVAILSRGLVQVYTGPGKGKTTAALGLAWRMLGSGGAVYVCQFCKPTGQETGEAVFGEELAGCLEGRFRFDRLAEGWEMWRCDTDPAQAERMRAAVGGKLREIAALAAEGEYDLVIIDELVFCLAKGLADREEVEGLLDGRSGHVEVVLTGREAPQWLIERADLVSEISDVKHPFAGGMQARRGIEY